MTELEREIRDVFQELGISSTIREDDKKFLLERLKNTFVQGNPRCWWQGLQKIKQLHFSDNSAPAHLTEIALINSEDFVWFIADGEEDGFFTYCVQFKHIEYIVNNCRYFEYYIVPLDFNLIIAENDHGSLIIGSALE